MASRGPIPGIGFRPHVLGPRRIVVPRVPIVGPDGSTLHTERHPLGGLPTPHTEARDRRRGGAHGTNLAWRRPAVKLTIVTVAVIVTVMILRKRTCAAPDCRRVFRPKTRRQRFHSETCANRVRQQRWARKA